MAGASRMLLPTSKRFFPNRLSEVLQVAVTDVNMRSWTVDVTSRLLGRYWADVQVGAAYLHQHAGEGVFCMPEVGSVCMLCIPSDTSGPFIMSFVSPGQTTNAGQAVDARDQGMTGEQYDDYSKQPAPNRDVDYSYSSNRPIAKPGDIVMRGRDGNFCILHRGGVLQIGSSELAQRIYVPLTNMVTDVSEHYQHHNVAGTIDWGMQPMEYEERETWWRQCFRVFADDKHCDMRLTVGNVDSCPLPDGDEDWGDNPVAKPLCYELVLIPAGEHAGFRGVAGEVVESSHNQMKMLFEFDRAGRCYCRFDGNALLSFKQNLFLKVKGDFTVQAKSINMTTPGDATLGADGTTNVKGAVVKLGGGGVGVARAMDQVLVPGPQLVAALGALGVAMTSPGAAAAVGLLGGIMTSSAVVESS